MTDQVMEELWNGLSPATSGVELINAVVDRLLELNIDLQDVSLNEMKILMSSASKHKAKGDSQKRRQFNSDCMIAS